jgi:hypothetical protein
MRQQNFHKNPHTARFLQTFHSGIGSNGMNYRAGLVSETDEERQAMEFIGATGAAPTREIFIKGWRILTGPGLVSEAQAKWIVDIAETKDGVTDEMIKSLSVRLEQGFAKAAASAFITKYKDLPKRVTAGPGEDPTVPVRDAQDVPAGRYALMHADGIKFYRVTEGKGRWAGRTFVEAQASDDHFPIRNAEARQAILAAIAEAPEEAATRYGVELGSCYRCGRTLTDETSRALGIGPDCRSKL